MPAQPRKSRAKRPSMYDVARLAGVSQTTVSFVVNDAPNANIPDETRERIWAAVRELGWRPNAMARALSLRQSDTIGFISDEIATSSHAGMIIQGAQDAAWAREKMLLVINTGGARRLEERAFEMMLERQVEGLIYATMYHHAVELPPIESETPLVLLDCFAPGSSLPSVVPDEAQGARAAVEALLARGHRRIGFINNSDPIPARDGRLAGYTQALASAGIAYDPARVRAGHSTGPEGLRCAAELLDLPERPTALFCFSDVMAMGAYEAIKSRGLRIPDDVAVVGFDNLEVVAAHLYPPLSTIELPHYQMGEWAVNYLLGHADVPLDGAPAQHRIPCRLVERASA
ncbi:MAG TPA: LacI family DNA-binding transcriptional regulator [Chloroflexaceae bacterium]|nr:LacI family DNA-binding transcriptional regulator [Chloroflexaceae bacterium]